MDSLELIVKLLGVTDGLVLGNVALLKFVGRTSQMHKLVEVVLSLSTVLVREVGVEVIHINHFGSSNLFLVARMRMGFAPLDVRIVLE